MSSEIIVKGARQHNLKNIDVHIPRNAIAMVTGLSGSGKSSLVFDTILAEAQRRFFYTLSHYSRQFLEGSPKPDVDRIDGLSPAISLAQNETLPSKKASVGSHSDINELLGVLFSKFSEKKCPKHNIKAEAQSLKNIARQIESMFEDRYLMICAPFVEQKKGHFRMTFEKWLKKGYLKAFINNKLVSLDPIPKLNKEYKHDVKLMIDLVKVTTKNADRIMRSLETSLQEKADDIHVIETDKKGVPLADNWHKFSTKNGCPKCSFSWPELDSRYFSANSLGACSVCHGLGYLRDDDDDQEDLSAKLDQFNVPLCDDCSGTGIKSELRFLTFSDHSIHDLLTCSIQDFKDFFTNKKFQNLEQHKVFKRLKDEILSQADNLLKLKLSYLNLSRRIWTLSGGELQRVKLASIFTENLKGVLYILDEPSQGLHPRELKHVFDLLQELKEQGNSIILVDHDEYFMKHCDQIIDMGPSGGASGGQILATFSPQEAYKYKNMSPTANFLAKNTHYGKLDTNLQDKNKPKKERTEATLFTLCDLSLNNLKIAKASIQVNRINTVAGVSGSGKSSFAVGSLYQYVKVYMEKTPFSSVQLIDRKPLAKSRVSTPATYLGIFTEIRNLFAALPDAQLYGLSNRDFSLHAKGGRCEECQGKGEITLSMGFLADARVTCSQCQGKRYQEYMLNLKYLDHSIYDVLQCSLSEALELFKAHKKITQKIKPAVVLGLGYLKLGQTTLSLSGGEAQRLKLVPFLAKSQCQESLVILDEPTQGLHHEDIKMLLHGLQQFIEKEGTLVIIEHNEYIIHNSHWIVGLGPGSAQMGGNLIYEGTPENYIKQGLHH